MKSRFDMVTSEAYTKPGLTCTPEVVYRAVSDSYGINREWLFNTTRRQPYAEARMVVFFLLQNIYHFTTLKIGALAHRDHVTVIYGIRKVKELAEFDPKVNDNLCRCAERLGISREKITEWLKTQS